MNPQLAQRLKEFVQQANIRGKGPLSIMLIVTGHARDLGLPLDPESLLTGSGAQVAGAGAGAVRKILKRYGIERELAKEGGRTSRGSLDNMRRYVSLLNDAHAEGLIESLDEVEAFWVGLVGEFFAGMPFRLRLDPARGLRSVIGDLVDQAIERQRASAGANCAGAVLQHLVGAKLSCAIGEHLVQHHSFSTADAPGGRPGDFLVGDVAVHVTTSPGEAVIHKCHQNLEDGYRPVLVTLRKEGVAVAEGLATNQGLSQRIDVFEVEQFVALNLYEIGKFEAAGRGTAIKDLVDRYNKIIDRVETDPSLKIDLR